MHYTKSSIAAHPGGGQLQNRRNGRGLRAAPQSPNNEAFRCVKIADGDGTPSLPGDLQAPLSMWFGRAEEEMGSGWVSFLAGGTS